MVNLGTIYFIGHTLSWIYLSSHLCVVRAGSRKWCSLGEDFPHVDGDDGVVAALASRYDRVKKSKRRISQAHQGKTNSGIPCLICLIF